MVVQVESYSSADRCQDSGRDVYSFFKWDCGLVGIDARAICPLALLAASLLPEVLLDVPLALGQFAVKLVKCGRIQELDILLDADELL